MVIPVDPLKSPIAPDLLPRARAGDADAFCQLIKPLQAALLRQATLLSGDPAGAEDLVSETFVAAWTSLARYDQSCRLSTWLYAILLHRHQKAIRRARSRPISLAWLTFFQADKLGQENLERPAPAPSPLDQTAQNETFAHLRRCIEQLPERHRQVIWLRFFEDASLDDIAKVLRCSTGTVKSRLHHALEKLRKMKVNLEDARGDKQV
jgi:RNA polymerase sigma-70 factor, ECF subfamily